MSPIGSFRFLGVLALTALVTACGGNLAHPAAPALTTQAKTPDKQVRSLAGRMQAVYDFQGSPDGQLPEAEAVLGKWRGTPDVSATLEGGDSNNDGTVVGLMLKNGKWIESVLYTFKNTPDGANPASSDFNRDNPNVPSDLTTTLGGANGLGAVVQLTPTKKGPWREQVIHSFSGYPYDGNQPWGTLIGDSQGNLYGTTYAGGAYNLGTVFRMQPKGSSWSENVLYSFSASGGSAPYAGLAMDSQGNLYGTTYQGGDSNNDGVVFKLTPYGSTYSESTIHTFEGYDGSAPYAGVCSDPSGNLYGTTVFGGSNGGGTLYELSPSGSSYSERVLWNFGASGDGANPMGRILMDKKGRLYGTTTYGGASNKGTFFVLMPSGGKYKENLYSFSGGTDGEYPYAGPSLDANGNILVTASQGGSGHGAVSKPSPDFNLSTKFCVEIAG